MRTPTKCAMSTQRRRWRIFLFCDWSLVISLSFKTSACVFILQKHQWFCAQSPSESSWARVHNLILLLYWFYLLTGAFQSALSVDCKLWHIQYCILHFGSPLAFACQQRNLGWRVWIECHVHRMRFFPEKRENMFGNLFENGKLSIIFPFRMRMFLL